MKLNSFTHNPPPKKTNKQEADNILEKLLQIHIMQMI